jgi:hypothetical protein
MEYSVPVADGSSELNHLLRKAGKIHKWIYEAESSYIGDSMAIIRILSARRRIVPSLLFPT